MGSERVRAGALDNDDDLVTYQRERSASTYGAAGQGSVRTNPRHAVPGLGLEDVHTLCYQRARVIDDVLKG